MILMASKKTLFMIKLTDLSVWVSIINHVCIIAIFFATFFKENIHSHFSQLKKGKFPFSREDTSRKSDRSQRDIIRRGGADAGSFDPVKVLTGLKSDTSQKSDRSQRDIIQQSGANAGSFDPVKVLTGLKSDTSQKSDRSQRDIIRQSGAKSKGFDPVAVLWRQA